MSLGALIGIGAGLGIVVGALIGEPALCLICGAGLGTVSGAVLETMRRPRSRSRREDSAAK
jgi:hypothetical protein